MIISEDNKNENLIADEKLLRNTLSNGFTYYIYNNKYPCARVILALIVKAGSAIEEEHNKGIAHFVEHMCLFDNTSLQSKGPIAVDNEFGGYTNYDETVFTIKCDSTYENVEKCILILKGIADGKRIKINHLEAVREIVAEEWTNTTRKINFRLRAKILPVILNGSQYSERIPIGDISSILKFDYETIMQFHNNWYIPEKMALIAVGDIESLWMQKLIENCFSDFSKRENLTKNHHRFNVLDCGSKRCIVNSFEEILANEVQVYYKQIKREVKTIYDLKIKLIESVYIYIIQAYLNKILLDADITIKEMYCTKEHFLMQYEFIVIALKTPDNFIDVISLVSSKLRKDYLNRYLVDELDNLKACFIKNLNQTYMQSRKPISDTLMKECLYHFLYNEPILPIDYEYEKSCKLIDSISAEDINQYNRYLFTACDSTIVINHPQNQNSSIDYKKLYSLLCELGCTAN